MSIYLSPARAEASRKNGAKSQGPITPEGKARSAQNALKHGLCADTYLVSAEEEEDAYEALEAAVLGELAPAGMLQTILARRIVRATWRLERAERIEAEMFENGMQGDDDLGLAIIRDGNATRSFDTMLRYRGSALAELFRALRTFKALQAEARTIPEASGRAVPQQRNEPDTRAKAGLLPPSPFANAPSPLAAAACLPGASTGPTLGGMAALADKQTNPKLAPILEKATPTGRRAGPRPRPISPAALLPALPGSP